MPKTPLYMAVRNNYLQTVARSGGGYLRCLTDADAHRWAQKIYATYISDSDYSKFPSFLTKLDGLLSSFGAKKSKNRDRGDDVVEDDEVDTRKSKKKKKKKNRG